MSILDKIYIGNNPINKNVVWVDPNNKQIKVFEHELWNTVALIENKEVSTDDIFYNNLPLYLKEYCNYSIEDAINVSALILKNKNIYTKESLIEDFNKAKTLLDSWDASTTSINARWRDSKFTGRIFPNLDFTNVTDAQKAWHSNSNILIFPELKFGASSTNFTGLFWYNWTYRYFGGLTSNVSSFQTALQNTILSYTNITGSWKFNFPNATSVSYLIHSASEIRDTIYINIPKCTTFLYTILNSPGSAPLKDKSIAEITTSTDVESVTLKSIFYGCNENGIINTDQDIFKKRGTWSGVIYQCKCRVSDNLFEIGADSVEHSLRNYLLNTYLNLKFTHIKSINVVAALLDNLKKLDVTFDNTDNITDGLKIINLGRQCPNLEEANLNFTSPRNITVFNYCFADCPKLKTLNIKNCILGPSFNEEAAIQLSKNESLSFTSIYNLIVNNLEAAAYSAELLLPNSFISKLEGIIEKLNDDKPLSDKEEILISKLEYLLNNGWSINLNLNTYRLVENNIAPIEDYTDIGELNNE